LPAAETKRLGSLARAATSERARAELERGMFCVDHGLKMRRTPNLYVCPRLGCDFTA
jgi:hypothetical protein